MSTPGSPAPNVNAWVPILGCTLVMTFVSGLTASGLGVLVHEWIKGFSVSTSKVMLILSGGSILSGFLGMTIGPLAGRFSPRALVFVGVVCGVASLVLGSLSPTFWVLLFTLGPLAAAGNALTGPVIGQTLAVRTFHRPGLAIASVTAGHSFSAIFAPPLLAVLLATILTKVFNLQDKGVAVVGQLPAGLPVPTLPPLGDYAACCCLRLVCCWSGTPTTC